MIQVKNLTFAYDKTPVLDDISFKLEPGQLVAVLGPNGAGKSTLFKCLLNLLKKYNGEILLNGKDVKQMSRKEIASVAAYIPQSESPAFNYTVRESILMGTTGMLSPLQMPGAEQTRIAEDAMDYLEIGYLADRGIEEISGGERQLVLLARALAQKARVLIMDEPTANLDYGNQQHVLKHIQKITNEGYTVLLSTHNPEHALQYASHILALNDHKVQAFGEVREVLTEDLIRKLYGLQVKIIETEIDGNVVRSCIPATISE